MRKYIISILVLVNSFFSVFSNTSSSEVDSICNLIEGNWYLFETCGNTVPCHPTYSSDLNQFERVSDTDSIIRKVTLKDSTLVTRYKLIKEKEFFWFLTSNDKKHKIGFSKGFFSFETGGVFENYSRIDPFAYLNTNGVDSISNLLEGDWYLFKTCGGVTGECNPSYSINPIQIERLPGTDSIIWKSTVNETVLSFNHKILYNPKYKWMLTNGNYDLIIDIQKNGSLHIDMGNWHDYYTRTKQTIISVKEHNYSSLKIYPNPCRNIFRISGIKYILQIEVLDVNGSTIKFINQDFDIIDMSGLKKGVYFIKIVTEDKVYFQKIIKI